MKTKKKIKRNSGFYYVTNYDGNNNIAEFKEDGYWYCGNNSKCQLKDEDFFKIGKEIDILTEYFKNT